MIKFRKTPTEKAFSMVLKHSKQQPLLVPIAVYFAAKNAELAAKGIEAVAVTSFKAIKLLWLKGKEWGALVAEEASAQFSKIKGNDEIV